MNDLTAVAIYVAIPIVLIAFAIWLKQKFAQCRRQKLFNLFFPKGRSRSLVRIKPKGKI